MGNRIIQTLAVVIQADTAQNRGVDQIMQLDLLGGRPGELVCQFGRLLFAQGDGSDGGDGQNAIVAVLLIFKGLEAVVKMLHVTLFSEDLQEVQHIGLNLSTEAVIENLAAFLLGEIGRGKQTDIVGVLTEALGQNGQFSQQLLGELLLLRQSIQRFAINISYLGHT